MALSDQEKSEIKQQALKELDVRIEQLKIQLATLEGARVALENDSD